jgi:hypothetical protein
MFVDILFVVQNCVFFLLVSCTFSLIDNFIFFILVIGKLSFGAIEFVIMLFFVHFLVFFDLTLLIRRPEMDLSH